MEEDVQSIDHTELSKIFEQHGYVFVKSIGKGGFAETFLLNSIKYQCQFCAKVFFASIERHENLKLSYEREINALLKLSHPFIEKVYDHFTYKDNFILILEFCPGLSLQQIISSTGPLHYSLLVLYSHHLLEALQFCHSHNVCHGDIKPSNIMASGESIKIIDFGLALHCDCEKQKVSGGSIPYFAPEMFRNNPVDPTKCDIWAAGVTFYNMAFGRRPFNGENTEQLKQVITMGLIPITEHINPLYIDLIKQCLCVNPQNRPSAEQLLKLPVFNDLISEERVRFSYQKSSSLMQISRSKRPSLPTYISRIHCTNQTKNLSKSSKMFNHLPMPTFQDWNCINKAGETN